MEDYLVRPRVGSLIPTTITDEYTDIFKIVQHLNNPNEQHKALELLGIQLINDARVLVLTFKEMGYPYDDPTGDRSKKQVLKVSREVIIRCSVEESILLPLPIEVNLEPYFEMGINFFGRIKFTDSQGNEHGVPLIGTGSVALEGRYNDCHAGFCTDEAEASFQQRVALCYAIASACGVNERYLTVMELRFTELDRQFHGRPDILEYTYLCCRQPANTRESYLRFMINKYEEKSDDVIPPMLKSYRQNKCPLPEYYESLRLIFGESDVVNEAEFWRSRQPSVPIGPANCVVTSETYYSPLIVLTVGTIGFTLLAVYLHSRSSMVK